MSTFGNATTSGNLGSFFSIYGSGADYSTASISSGDVVYMNSLGELDGDGVLVYNHSTGTFTVPNINASTSLTTPTLTTGTLTASTGIITDDINSTSGPLNLSIGSTPTLIVNSDSVSTEVKLDVSAGLYDAEHTSTAIEFMDGLNTTLSTTNQTIVGAINEIYSGGSGVVYIGLKLGVFFIR